MLDLCFVERMSTGVSRCDHVVFTICSGARRCWNRTKCRKHASNDIHRIDNIEHCTQEGSAAMVALSEHFSVRPKLERPDIHESVEEAFAAYDELIQTYRHVVVGDILSRSVCFRSGERREDHALHELEHDDGLKNPELEPGMMTTQSGVMSTFESNDCNDGQSRAERLNHLNGQDTIAEFL